MGDLPEVLTADDPYGRGSGCHGRADDEETMT
jgi:hypothetical protein